MVRIAFSIHDFSVLRVDEDAAPHGAERTDRVGLLGILDPESLCVGFGGIKVDAERAEDHRTAGNLEKVSSRYSHRYPPLYNFLWRRSVSRPLPDRKRSYGRSELTRCESCSSRIDIFY